MRFGLLLTLASVGGFGVVSTARAATAEKWVCVKEGKEVKVKGKTDNENKKLCEDQGATWEKAPAEEPKKQAAGDGGGW